MNEKYIKMRVKKLIIFESSIKKLMKLSKKKVEKVVMKKATFRLEA